MAAKRAWTVPEDLPEHDGIYPIDRNHAAEAFVEAESILQRMGGVMMIAPVRMEVSEGRWITRGYTFRHESYIPAERKPKGIRVDDTGDPIVVRGNREAEPAEVGQ